MKKILFALLIFASYISLASAESCDKKDIKRLKEIASGIEITNEWLGKKEDETGISANMYKFSIFGMTNELYALVKETNKKYDYTTVEDGIITDSIISGKKTIDIYSVECRTRLRDIIMDMPIYNYYANDKLCIGIKKEQLAVCDEWYPKKISWEEFKSEVNKYKNNDRSIVNKLKDNYMYLILFTTTIIICILVIIIIQKKRSSLL